MTCAESAKLGYLKMKVQEELGDNILMRYGGTTVYNNVPEIVADESQERKTEEVDDISLILY